MNFILKRKNIYLLIFIYSIIAILSAIYIEKVLGYLPCKLCIYQRIPFLVAIFICFLGYNYFKSDRAHFDRIEMTSIIDATARQNAIMNGDVDCADKVDLKTVALLARSPNLEIDETTGTAHYTFPMRLDVDPFGDYDLRMALKLSVKRQELVDKILLGHGAVGNDHPISPTQAYHADALSQLDQVGAFVGDDELPFGDLPLVPANGNQVVHAVDGAQKGALAATGRANQGRNAVLSNRKRDAVERLV